MTRSNGSIEQDRLRKIAESYKQRGYKVTVSPPAERLPKFLSTFAPDIVAKGRNESVVVQVRSPGRLRGTSYWERLLSAVRQHPRWRIELVMDEVDNRPNPRTINERQIEEQLQEGERLAEQGMLAAGLLVTWAASEAAMRRAGKKHEVEFPDFRASTLITRLYSDGLLERKEYDFLLDVMRVRIAVAHGFVDRSVKLSSLSRLQGLTRRLLQ